MRASVAAFVDLLDGEGFCRLVYAWSYRIEDLWTRQPEI